MKKIVSLTLALIMLMGILACAPVSAESVLVDGDILNSIGEDAEISYNMAFRVTANVSGMAVENGSKYIADYTNATTRYNGSTATVVEMGMVVTNVDMGENVDGLNLDAVNGSTILRIPAVYLYATPQPGDTQCVFATRITRIPASARGRKITARPYFILQMEGTGAQEVVYTDTDSETYCDVWSDTIAVPAEEILVADQLYLEKITPSVVLDSENYDNVRVSAAFTLRNEAATITTNSVLNYVCYDKNGVAIENGQIDINGVEAGGKKTVSADVPAETWSIQYSSAEVNFFVLPAIGSDIDVTKKKNRIRVSAASASLNDNGTYGVSLTFKNYTSNWITEETDYVKYTCYDANGTAISTTMLYIGCIDTKKHPTKTFTFDVPANTVEVKLTDSKIVYWTEWS